MRLIAPDVEKQHLSDEELTRKTLEVDHTLTKIRKKGTDREKLIIDLYDNISIVPPGRQIMGYSGVMLLKEFQQSRSIVEAMSDDVLRETVRMANEEFKQKCGWDWKNQNQPEDTQIFSHPTKE